MATPDQGRRRTWRFRLNEATTLEVSTPAPATEKQVRRRGRWSLILGTLIAAIALVSTSFGADLKADLALGTSGIQQNKDLGNVIGGNTYTFTDNVFYQGGPSGGGGKDLQSVTFNDDGTLPSFVTDVTGGTTTRAAGSNAASTTVASTVTVVAPCTTGVFGANNPSKQAGSAVQYIATAVGGTGSISTADVDSTTAWVNITGNVTSLGASCATNNPPIVAANNATVTVDEGSLASNTGTWSDANAGDTVSLSASIGTISQAGTNAAGTWNWSFQTTDGPDESQTVTITANDTHTTTTTTFALVVDNVAPTVAFTGGPASVDESSSAVTYSYSIDDPGADTVQSVIVSCGSLGTVSNETNTNTTGSFDCTFLDGLNPATTSDVTVQATDSDGLAGNTATRTVTVNNANPVVSALTLGGNSGTACIGGNTVTLDFGFSDAGINDNPWAVDINWGDSNHTTYNASSQGAQTQQSHLYAAGSYTVSVSVTDKDSGAGSNSSPAGAVSFLYNVSGVLQPVNDTQAHNDPSVFKHGSTIPVKIKVTDCNNLVVSGLSPQIAVKKISGSTPASGLDETISSTSGADTGTTMRYSDGIYIYNLATKSLADSTATYELKITGPFATVTTLFGTRAK